MILFRRRGVAEKVSETRDHYIKTLENCIRFLLESRGYKAYRCLRCGRIFFGFDVYRCPFCYSELFEEADAKSVSEGVERYCRELYEPTINYLEFLAGVVENFCGSCDCSYYSTYRLTLLCGKSSLSISLEKSYILVSLSNVYLDTLYIANDIVSLLSRYREKLVRSGIRFVAIETKYDELHMDYKKLVEEGFLDATMHSSIVKMYLPDYYSPPGYLVKIISIKDMSVVK